MLRTHHKHTGTMSESVGSSPSLKSTISEELQELREKGLAKSNRGKFKDSGESLLLAGGCIPCSFPHII